MSSAPVVAPSAQQAPVHPPIPLGLGSYVTLTGAAGAVAAFLIAWAENNWHLTGAIAALGVTAGGAIATWFAGRSHQAAALITVAQAALHDVGIDITPPK
jgi:hypothetical protein